MKLKIVLALIALLVIAVVGAQAATKVHHKKAAARTTLVKASTHVKARADAAGVDSVTLIDVPEAAVLKAFPTPGKAILPLKASVQAKVDSLVSAEDACMAANGAPVAADRSAYQGSTLQVDAAEKACRAPMQAGAAYSASSEYFDAEHASTLGLAAFSSCLEADGFYSVDAEAKMKEGTDPSILVASVAKCRASVIETLAAG
jgi:hypothetical protein